MHRTVNHPIARDDPTTEWVVPHPDHDLRQGDVLHHTGDEQATSLLLILTTDCDLANEKHRGRLMCAPILLLEEHFSENAFARELRQAEAELDAAVYRLIEQQRNRAGVRSPTPERVREWCREVGIDEIVAVLEMDPSSPEVAQLTALTASLRHPLPIPPGLAAQVVWLQRVKAALSPKGKAPDAGMKAASKAIVQFVKQPPRDNYLLAEVAPDHREGYVVDLRFPTQVLCREISLTPGRGASTYQRIARIGAPYIYSICQQFGHLFTSVGLPDAQRESVRISADLVLDNVSSALEEASSRAPL